MTPEQIQQVKDGILISRQHDAYSHERDAILADIGQAYAAMRGATSRYKVLAQRVAGGDLTALQTHHTTMAAAMAGQDAEIQAAFIGAMATLEEAQAIVFSLTEGRFLPVVPLPEVEEVE
jgi:hypothetical protein